MTKLFEWNEQGPILVVNPAGDKIELKGGDSHTIENLVGARVQIKHDGQEITCEARMPDYAGILRWRFQVDDRNITPINNGSPLPSVCNLASLIAESRVQILGHI